MTSKNEVQPINLDLLRKEAENYAVPDIKSITEFSKIHDITDEQSMIVATNAVAQWAGIVSRAEKEKERLYRPFKDAADNVSAWFKEKLVPINDAIKAVNQKQVVYTQKQRLIQAEIERKQREDEQKRIADQIEAEKEAAELFAAPEVVAQAEIAIQGLEIQSQKIEAKAARPTKVAMTKTESGSFTTRFNWVGEVTDIKALAAANPELILPNMPAINALIKAGTRELAGVKIYQQETGVTKGW